MPKTLFLSQGTCAERWEWGCESDRFSTEATVGGLSGDAWPVSPWPVPRAAGTGSGEGSWEGHKPSSVCLYQTTIRYFIQMASEHRALWGSSEGSVTAPHFCILIMQLPLLVQRTLCGFMFVFILLFKARIQAEIVWPACWLADMISWCWPITDILVSAHMCCPIRRI